MRVGPARRPAAPTVRRPPTPPSVRPTPAVTPNRVAARTMRTPGADSQRAISAISSTSAPPSGAGSGRIACAASAVSRRRPASAAHRGARRPPPRAGRDRTTASCQPPSPSGRRRPVRSTGGQRAQPLAAPQHVDGCWRCGRAAGRRSRSGWPRPARRPGQHRRNGVQRRRCCPDAVDQRRRPPRRRRVVGGGDVARCRARRELTFGTGGPVLAPRARCRVVQVRTPVNRAISSAVSTASARDRNGPIARSWRGLADHREPRERLVGQHHPPPAVREARSAVVRRGVGGQQPQLAHAGLQRVGAFDVVDRGGQADHLLHARPRGSAPLKYWPTRRRRSIAVPT